MVTNARRVPDRGCEKLGKVGPFVVTEAELVCQLCQLASVLHAGHISASGLRFVPPDAYPGAEGVTPEVQRDVAEALRLRGEQLAAAATSGTDTRQRDESYLLYHRRAGDRFLYRYRSVAAELTGSELFDLFAARDLGGDAAGAALVATYEQLAADAEHEPLVLEVYGDRL